MMNNENRDEDEKQRTSDRYDSVGKPGWWWRSLAAERVIVVPSVFVGIFLGFLVSIKLFGIDRAFLPLVAGAIGGAAGAAFGKFAIGLVRRAAEAARRARHEPRVESQPATKASTAAQRGQAIAAEQPIPASKAPSGPVIRRPVSLPGEKPLSIISRICGGLGAVAALGLVSGLVPASFGSVAFTLISFGAAALSYVLGKRARS